MIRLHINIDHIATVREARRSDEPDPVRAAVLAELGGADGITVHLREDRRHIQDRDVRLLMQTVRTGVNLELAAASDVLAVALELRPMTATLVPERRDEITTEGGLALTDTGPRQRVGAALEQLRTAGIRSSLFLAPDRKLVDIALQLGADAVELHTGEYAHAWGRRFEAEGGARVAHELQCLRQAAAHAHALGLGVHAGHGLTYENVHRIAGIGDIEELNIGHSVISRAFFTGLERAVRELRAIIGVARREAGA